MNAYTFNSDSFCPICQRTVGMKPFKMVGGLLTCPHCRERLVVSWSGHYVRDPFTLRQVATERMLRRQSRPLARFWRDAGLGQRLSIAAIVSGAMLLGLAMGLLTSSGGKQPPIEGLLNQTSPTLKVEPPSP